MKRRVLVALLGVLGALLQGCSGTAGSGSYPASPDAIVLDRLPRGLPQHQVVGHVLTAADVAVATPADPARARAFLAGSTFGEGYARTWEQGSDYVTIIAVAFRNEKDVPRMVSFEVGELGRGINAYVTGHQQLPGSSVFVISSKTRSADRDVICEGVWMPAGYYAIETLTCSEGGAWATWAEDLAQRELTLEHQVTR